MPVLKVDGLTHAYGSKVVLAGVSFSVGAGKAVALVGPNGVGKSTLLRCLVGAEKPSKGKVTLDGKAYDESDPKVRKDVATVFDDLDFFPDVTVAEHLDLLARAHGVADAEATVDAVLYDLGLDGASDQFPGTLSSGQRHRFALATAFVRPRRVLLLDEPEQRLDAAGRAYLAKKLTAEKKAGTALVFASHLGELVDAVADRVIDLAPEAAS